jgi:hypothetical protein
MSDIWEIIQKVENSDDPNVWKEEYQNILPMLKQYWDQHPHSAMEFLQGAAKVFPLDIAEILVREVVRDWKKRSDYSWEAGGSADHCFLSALFLTGNYDLAEKAHIIKCGKSILDNVQRMNNEVKDKERKIKLLKDGLINYGII